MAAVVYEELDNAKAEIERLKKQYQVKAELAESLKRTHSDQLSKNKEACSKLEKLARELDQKDDEISNARQIYEGLKSILAEKEAIIRHLSSSHEKLRLDCNEKLKRCEDENKALALALDDADGKNIEQERQICTLKQEIEGAKRLFTSSVKKCSEHENRTIASEKYEAREDEFFKLDEEKRNFEDQLKWKREQFVHLQEAHEKLRNEYKTREKEWEKDKTALLDGISSLQTNLESQTRISRDLERRLEMCNQALAHAESKRKQLEVQLSESRTSFDSVCAEYDEAKLNFENLTIQRDKEIGNLRSSLGTKEILYKEMEYQFKKSELEKQELLASLKELQDEQIREAGFSHSSSKLQNKLKSSHKGCLTSLKAKESEWQAQREKLIDELNSCRGELKNKDTSLSELSRELETCDSLIVKLELMNQETSLLLLVLKSEFSELAENKSCCLNVKNKDMHDHMHELVKQLDKKKAAVDCIQKDLEDERAEVVNLSEKVKTLENLQLPLQKEVERLKGMLEESEKCRIQFEEQLVKIQCDLKQAHDALDRANEELCEKYSEASEIEYELQIWKSIAEQMEVNLKHNLQIRCDVEASLFSQMEVEMSLKQERENLSRTLEEKEKQIDDLKQRVNEATTDLKTVEEENNTAEEENEAERTFYRLVEEKDQRIYELQQLVASLEKEFESSTLSFSSKLSKMQRERNVLSESWEKVKSDEVLKEMEVQEKNGVIMELENDLRILRQRADEQEKELFSSKKKIREIRAELEANIRDSEKTIEKLSSENEKLESMISLLSEKMDQYNTEEDLKLMESLGKIVAGFEISGGDVVDDDDAVKENVNIVFSSPLMKKVEAARDERSPLRAINC
ncbi:basic helix-loop-helix (bHLH) DNA-binding superfamily protein [Striga hermonthica]|uniref:Basic helix-loop-helix (BHLH) DNA-binding superfamily protein n=1 Tax=Striga hermonthica TaxID=68872 RepID=A0A9N7RJ05_STRHE|nr:basic helix-loop-helix (bHLH) DNA-binding superfamily protein [Striga hermonthica]